MSINDKTHRVEEERVRKARNKKRMTFCYSFAFIDRWVGRGIEEKKSYILLFEENYCNRRNQMKFCYNRSSYGSCLVCLERQMPKVVEFWFEFFFKFHVHGNYFHFTTLPVSVLISKSFWLATNREFDRFDEPIVILLILNFGHKMPRKSPFYECERPSEFGFVWLVTQIGRRKHWCPNFIFIERVGKICIFRIVVSFNFPTI